MQILKKKGNTSVEPEIRMGICMLPPCQPQDKIPIRIHTLDHTCCRLQVRLDATAKAIMEEACDKLRLPAGNYELCEIKSSGGMWEGVEVCGGCECVHWLGGWCGKGMLSRFFCCRESGDEGK